MPQYPIYFFAPFRLNADQRLLSANDLPLKLGGRAFDLLLALVERRERTVTKHELLDIVWPGLVVEENNLQVQVVTLRKALGHHAIATVPGRGYRFTLPVTVEGSVPIDAVTDLADPARPGASLPPGSERSSSPVSVGVSNLPYQGNGLFGRDGDIDAIRAMLRDRRLVTIAGAGGIGKTRVAEAVASAAAGDFADGAWWVDLAAITDPDLVPTAVARALGLSVADSRDTLQGVIARIGGRSMLLVLDNCEHLLEGVAEFVDAATAAAPMLRILVTSQEVLKTMDEHVFRLGTLTVATAPDVDAVASSGAGALLLARIKGAMPRFELTANNAGAVAEICRRLDGIPLAIELAAARVPLLGIEGVRAKLDERFRMLTAGARVVLRRHQTLRAALEWSHALLTDDERVVFRRLGVFVGGFTLESAQRVADDDDIDAWDVLEQLGALVDKSLVLAEGDAVPRYRLLETTRLYALEQLALADETAIATEKHARAITTLLEAFESPARYWRSTPADWAAAAAELDNTRVALAWAYQHPERVDLSLELASSSLYAFTFSNVVGEGFQRVLAFSGRASTPASLRTCAGFWLALARLGTAMARPEALDAAIRANQLYADLGDDVRQYAALTSCVAIAARLDGQYDAEVWIEQAVALARDSIPPRVQANFEWARHRWLLREGRPDQAIVHAMRQVELTRISGAERSALLIEGMNVAYCELAMGDAAGAERRAGAALKAAGPSDVGAGHLLDTLTMSLAVLGRLEESLSVARRAFVDLEASGDQFMMFDGLAMIAAEQGRLRDAAIAAARSDLEFATRKFRRWPLSLEWRRRTDALLTGVADDDLACWTRDAVRMKIAVATGHALGRASAIDASQSRSAI